MGPGKVRDGWRYPARRQRPLNSLREPRYELLHQGDDLTKLVWLDSVSKSQTTSVLLFEIMNILCHAVGGCCKTRSSVHCLTGIAYTNCEMFYSIT